MTNTVPEQRFQELLAKPDPGLQHRSTLATFYFTLQYRSRPVARKARIARSAFARGGPASDHRVGDARRPGPRVFTGSGRRLELRAARTTAGATPTATDRLARARRLVCGGGLFGRAAAAPAAALQRERAGPESLHRHRSDVEGSARRRNRARADGIQGLSGGARGSGPVGRRPRRMDRGLQRCLDLSRHDDQWQPAELRPLVERRIRPAARLCGRRTGPCEDGATCCSRRSR